jgi:F-type H+-transporting ATPase subunit b
MDRARDGFATGLTWGVPLLLGSAPALARAAEEGLSLVPDPLRLALNFTALLALIYPVHRFLLLPLSRVLEQRRERTSGALVEAERQLKDAGELAGAIERRLAAARQEGQARRLAVLAEAEAAERELLSGAREEAARSIESLRTRIAGDTRSAREALPNLTRDLARQAATRLLGRAL